MTRLPIDLREQGIDEVLLACDDFDESKPVLFIWEGGSMYYDEVDTKRILSSISQLLIHEKSRIWFDFASKEAVDDNTGHISVESFIAGMRRMGEPFIKGYSEIDKELPRYGLEVENLDYSNKYLNSEDPIYSHYAFCIAKKYVG